MGLGLLSGGGGLLGGVAVSLAEQSPRWQRLSAGEEFHGAVAGWGRGEFCRVSSGKLPGAGQALQSSQRMGRALQSSRGLLRASWGRELHVASRAAEATPQRPGWV